MKTLDEIKDDYARSSGYDDWNEIIYSESDPNVLDKIYDEVTITFAEEVARYTQDKCATRGVVHVRYNKADDIPVVLKMNVMHKDNLPKLRTS